MRKSRNESASKRWLGLGKAVWALLALLVVGPAAGYIVNRELTERDDAKRREAAKLQAARKAAEERRQPLEITIETDPVVFEKGRPDWTGYSFVTQRTAQSVPPPPRGECRSRRSWARRFGAADADFTRIHVGVRGRPAAPVRIANVEVLVHERRPPIRGTHLVCPVGGATPEFRGLVVNLDRDPPDVSFVDPRGGKPITPPYIVSRSEEEILEIEARTTRCYCTWSAQIIAFVAGKRRAVNIGGADKPFETSPSAQSETVEWSRGRWRKFEP